MTEQKKPGGQQGHPQELGEQQLDKVSGGAKKDAGSAKKDATPAPAPAPDIK